MSVERQGWKTEEIMAQKEERPILAMEANMFYRIRLLGPASCSQILGTKFANEIYSEWIHNLPDALKEATKTFTTNCIGVKNGCLFCDGVLGWDKPRNNTLFNVVVYEGVDARANTFTDRYVIGFNLKWSLWNSMKEQVKSIGYNEIDEVDWIVSKTGTKITDIKYHCTAVYQCLEADVDLNGFPVQDGYADDDFPMLVDFNKFNPNKLLTPQHQEEWYNKLQLKVAVNEEGAFQNAQQKPPQMQLPTGIQGLPASSIRTPAQQITMENAQEGKRRGRPPKNSVVPQVNIGVITGQSNLPGIPKNITPVADPYSASCATLDPWGTALKTTEHLDFILEATPEQMTEYSITQSMRIAAGIVKAGPQKPAVPTLPSLLKLPGLPQMPKAGVVITAQTGVTAQTLPLVQTATPAASGDLTGVRNELSQLMNALPVLKSFANRTGFFKTLVGPGVMTVNQISDLEQLNGLIELCNQGNDYVAQAIGVPA